MIEMRPPRIARISLLSALSLAMSVGGSLLAGSLFPVSLLPEWLQVLSWAIPHTYVINAARTVLMDDPGAFAISFSNATLALLVFNVVVMSLGLWVFSRSLEYGRKMGLLSGY